MESCKFDNANDLCKIKTQSLFISHFKQMLLSLPHEIPKKLNVCDDFSGINLMQDLQFTVILSHENKKKS